MTTSEKFGEAGAPPAAAGTSDLAELLRRRALPLVADGQVVGVVLGAVRGPSTAIACAGRTALRGGRDMTADVPHELGSVTKTFTALLLAVLADGGVVGLDDPVAAHLPDDAAPADRRITLLELATHTAGLPRNPITVYRRMLRSGWRNPYAGYTVDDLYRTTARLRPRPHRYHYSSLGFGLLGQALANATATPYPRLLAERVLRPLRMADAGAELTPRIAALAATGHRRGRATPPWQFQALAGAGALRCDGNDMVRFLRAQLDPGPYADAVRATHVPRAPGRGGSVCLGWFRREVDGRPLLWHDGGTAGFTAFLAISPTTGTGMFLLANTTPGTRQPALHAARRAFKDLLADP